MIRIGNWNSASHNKYLLRYHLIFVCKYRKKLLVNQNIAKDIKRLSFEICSNHDVYIKYMETDKDHIHYLIETRPNLNLSSFIRTVKNYTAYHIWQTHSGLLRKHFWKERTFRTDGCFICSVGSISEKTLKVYIENAVMNKAIKYRLYPTEEQKTFFAKTFGCCRKIWNLMLADKILFYDTHKKMLQTTPAQYKKDYPYLKKADSLALANVQLNLQAAFGNFFRDPRIGFPKFKSAKRSKKSYTTNNQKGTIALFEKGIKLPKIGVVKAKIHRKPDLDWKLKSAAISQSSDGKYYVSVLFEFDLPVQKSASANCIGLDYKSDGLYSDSEGNVCGSPKYFRKSQARLAKAQKKLSRQVIGSRNYKKQKKAVAKIHIHIDNQRKDFLHKKSTEIANQYDIVCVESLNMKAMSSKGFGNGKTTMDNGNGMFLTMLAYKLAARGKQLVKVGKWYASSQICSNCGENTGRKSLEIREWDCPFCHVHHDRDINAAINIKNEGLRLLGAV